MFLGRYSHRLRRILRAILPKPIALRLRQEWHARIIAKGGGHLEGEIELLPQLITPNDVCWDIGANVGMYTVALSRIARRVVAFEPVPHNFSTLRQAVRLARLGNVELHQIAMSDAKGRARFSVPVEQGFYGGYYMAAFHEHGELEVETDTVDDLIERGMAAPDFIKCDVEGAEVRVIQGARKLIARRHPTWLLETFDAGVLELMDSLGYEAYIRTPDNTLRRVSAALSEFRNYVFLPASRA